ncbi:unnamed protein product, partial [Symbiodinium sp. CCMP2456]
VVSAPPAVLGPEETKQLYVRAKAAAERVETAPPHEKAAAWQECNKTWDQVMEAQKAAKEAARHEYKEAQKALAAVEAAPASQRAAAWRKCEATWAAAMAKGA